MSPNHAFVAISNRKSAQIEAIKANIHTIEGLRNKLRFSFSEMAHGLDLLTVELDQIYRADYPLSIMTSHVDTNKKQRNILITALLRDTTLSIETIGNIVNQQKLYSHCLKHNLWPANRKNSIGPKSTEPERKIIELLGNKREIKVIVGKIKKVLESNLDIDPSFDRIGYIGGHIDNESILHNRVKSSIANAVSGLIMSEDIDTPSKIKDRLVDLKNENDRHQFSVSELIALSDSEQDKMIFDGEAPEGIEHVKTRREDSEVFEIPFTK